MDLTTLRATLLRPGAVQRTVILLGVVVAVVAGLLAMHTIASGMTGHSDPATAAMTVTTEHHAEAPSQPAENGECTGECAPDHDMTAMACILALLFGSGLLLFGFLCGVRSYTHASQLRPREGVSSAVRSVPFRDPPDLFQLSISRT